MRREWSASFLVNGAPDQRKLNIKLKLTMIDGTTTTKDVARFWGLIWRPAGSQLDHAFPETDGSERSQTDTKASPFEFRRPPESRQDTRGHGADTVRDREAEGSNPSPPTIFVFGIGDS